MNVNGLFAFLNGLAANNDKLWFDANRDTYQQHRKEFILFVDRFIQEASVHDSRLLNLVASKSIFRINRDIRFSANKNPYKTNFGMNLNIAGSKEEFLGYYLHLEPGKSFFAMGAYMPASARLAAIRQEIDYSQQEFLSIVESTSVSSTFGQMRGSVLSSSPRGYAKDHPLIPYLKHKDFILEKQLGDNELNSAGLLENLVNLVAVGKPFMDFLLRASAS